MLMIMIMMMVWMVVVIVIMVDGDGGLLCRSFTKEMMATLGDKVRAEEEQKQQEQRRRCNRVVPLWPHCLLT